MKIQGKEKIPKKEKRINNIAPSCSALLLAIFVVPTVCTFSVRVVDPRPVPHNPAMILVTPSRPIPLLTIPCVGGLKFTSKAVA